MNFSEQDIQEVYCNAVMRDPTILEFIEDQTEKLCRVALQWVRNEDIVEVFKMIKDKTPTLCELALKRCRPRFKKNLYILIEEPTEKMNLIAIDDSSVWARDILECIENKTIDVWKAAVSQDGSLVKEFIEQVQLQKSRPLFLSQ